MSTATISCPFAVCEARPQLLPTKSAPGQPQFIIAQHVCKPDSWFGMCPASLMPWPIWPAADELLAQQLNTFRTMRAERRRKQGEQASTPPPEHPSTPHPDSEPGPMWTSGN